MSPAESLTFPAVASRDWDVIVIGGGVLGAFHAYFALQRGLRTLLIERNPLPQDASVRNFGMIAAGGHVGGRLASPGSESQIRDRNSWRITHGLR